MTNLNNYVNLYAGAAPDKEFGAVRLAPFGAGSGMLGIPGDVTPPSRFVRAAFYQVTAPPRNTTLEAVMQGFQILSNFDIPIGTEFAADKIPADIPSATQWTSATDIAARKIYYRTMYNSAIRCIDLCTDRLRHYNLPQRAARRAEEPARHQRRDTVVSWHIARLTGEKTRRKRVRIDEKVLIL